MGIDLDPKRLRKLTLVTGKRKSGEGKKMGYAIKLAVVGS